MSARFCSKCGAPFRARGEVICGLCGEKRIIREGDDAEPEIPPELQAQLAAVRPITAESRRSPMLIGCLGVIFVGIFFAIGSSFCLRDARVNQPPVPTPEFLVTPAPFGPG